MDKKQNEPHYSTLSNVYHLVSEVRSPSISGSQFLHFFKRLHFMISTFPTQFEPHKSEAHSVLNSDLCLQRLITSEGHFFPLRFKYKFLSPCGFSLPQISESRGVGV